MNPLQTQVGGDHYAKLKIQPVEYIHANGLGFIEGSVIKYVTRHKSKNGKQDIEKAIHFLELLMEVEYGESAKKEESIALGPLDSCNEPCKARFRNAFPVGDEWRAIITSHHGFAEIGNEQYWAERLDSVPCVMCQKAAREAVAGIRAAL